MIINDNSTHGDGNDLSVCRSSFLMKRELLLGLVVVVTAFLVYANSLGNGFVWDDSNIIVTNKALQGSPLALFSSTDSARVEPTPFFRPLTILSFLAEDRLHGRNPLLMHLFNLLLHSFNAFLVFQLARALLGNCWTAMLAGLLFAVHPINAEGVNFLSGGRNTLLSCLFVLCAYILHRRSLIRGGALFPVVGALFFLAGLFSKETALGIIPFIIAIEYRQARVNLRNPWHLAAGRLLPYLVCTAGYVILRLKVLSTAGVELEIFTGLGTRILSNIYIVPRYFLSVVWPPAISNRYFVPADLHLLALPLAAFWLIIILALWWLLGRGRSQATLFGLSWMFLFMLPTSGIIPFPSAPLADRFFYTPGIGLWILLADQSGAVFERIPKFNRYGKGLLLAVLMVLAVFTLGRNTVWKDDFSLFSRYIQQYPDEAWGHHNLGCAYLEKTKNLFLAEKSFSRALELDPAFPLLQTQLGYVYLLRQDFAKALLFYTEALNQNPIDSEALLNRGEVLEQLGRHAEALESYRRFLDLSSQHNEFPWERPRIEDRVRLLLNMTRN